MKKSPLELDSIGEYDDSVEGDDGFDGGGFLPDGTRITFTNSQVWQHHQDGTVLDGLILVHLDTQRTEVKWGKNRKPVGPPRILAPGEKFRDVDAANELLPKSEWIEGYAPGELRGPLQNQNVVIFADLVTMQRYVWPSKLSTVGSRIAVRELAQSVQRMRRFRGLHVYAKVKLWKTDFPNKHGERDRPHLPILGWVTPTENGLVEVDMSVLPQLQAPAPQPATPTATPTSATPTSATSTPPTSATSTTPPWREVEEPSLKEELKDEIKF